jgi:hypothetical protein
MDKWHYRERPVAAAAPVGKYKGDAGNAFWFFDEEMVRATENYESAWREEKAPLLGFVQEGRVVPQRNTHLQVHLKFLPEEDGVSFFLRGAFLDTVPGESPRPAAWTGLPVGSRVGHPGDDQGMHPGDDMGMRSGNDRGMRSGNDQGMRSGNDVREGVRIRIDKVIGPFTKINDTMFRVSMEKGAADDARSYTLTFAAVYPGDAVYKPAVQQAEMVIPAFYTEGKEQQIIFPAISDQRRTGGVLHLGAVSSAGLPVYYYVKEGPAVVKDGVLSFTAIPPRSRYPIRVTVVAWQYGRRSAPAVATATPVERIFYIVND